MSEDVLHAIECERDECKFKWATLTAGDGISVQPKCLCIHALDGYETYKINDHTIGLRPIWFDVKTQLPPLARGVLVTDGLLVGYAMWDHKQIKWVRCESPWEDFRCNVTHWMPLPKPPEKPDQMIDIDDEMKKFTQGFVDRKNTDER